MKFAFATSISPTADIQPLADRAKTLGYDGVELAALPDDPDRAGAVFREAGVAVACLACPITMPARIKKRREAAAELVQYFNAAQRLDCRHVKIPGYAAPPGHAVNAAAVEFGHWLTPIGDEAAGRGIILLVENSNSFQKSKDLWMLMESVDHGGVAICWDLFNAFITGESPLISVPTLNSRIQYARLRDVQKMNSTSLQDCNLGEGNVPLEQFMTRLRGIGYAGFVTVQAPEASLDSALIKLRSWTKVETPAGKKAAMAR
jgi:sugar phosphate isomerase/epimerase